MAQPIQRTNLFFGFSTFNRRIGEENLIDIDLVKRDLLNQLGTRKGERLMLPDYGSIAWDLLFEPFDENVVDRIIADTADIIGQEPRVVLQNIEVFEFEHGLRLEVFLLFRPFEAVETLDVIFDRKLVERS